MRREIFYLAWHLKWSHGEIMALTVEERRGYVSMTSARIEQQNAELTALRGGDR